MPPFSEGFGLVDRVLRQGIGAVCEKAGISPQDISYGFFGMPTYGEVSGDVPVLDAAPRDILGHDRYAVDNDMVSGWAGSLGATDGINVICGTGSMTYGEYAGRGVRVGGWGELFGDEGSAYWIAIRGLNSFTQMSDGRLPEGVLVDVLREHLEIASDLDVIDVVLSRWQGGRSEIAALSRVVAEAARRGDTCAQTILTDAAHELVKIVDATRTRLEFPDAATVPVSYSGGVFNAELVLDGFARELRSRSAGFELRRPLLSPVMGAAMYAARLAGTPLDAAARALLLQAPEPTSSEGGADG